MLFEQERLFAMALEMVAHSKGKDKWVDRYVRRLLPYLFQGSGDEDAKQVLEKWVEAGPLTVTPMAQEREAKEIDLPKVDTSKLERVRVRAR